jgi:hypothetical protein
MRHLLLAFAVLCVALSSASADVARTTIGDIPRTFSHYMNAQEAALCRANAAAGGIAAYFFNPATISQVEGIEGHATVRLNLKDRKYLEGADDSLDATDDKLLFSQAVAAKEMENFYYGFGYSCPSYRSLELSGTVDGTTVYDADFGGSLRFFEVLAAARIGKNGQAGIGLAAGIGNISESAREREQRGLNTASMDGIAASVALGMVFDATDKLTFGVGYRFGTEFDVDGDWSVSDPEASGDAVGGKSKSQPVAVGGVRFAPNERYSLYASYIQEGWNEAESSFAAYYDTGECEECNENDGDRDEFDDSVGSIAVGGEGALMDGDIVVRAGFSKVIKADIDNESEPEYRELVPDYSIGLGGSLVFEQYTFDLALVRELFSDGDETEQLVNHGVYFSVGYAF